MEALKKIESLLEKELDKIAIKPELNATDLEIVCKVVKTIKYMDEVEDMEMDMGMEDPEYSGRYSMRGGRRRYSGRYPMDMWVKNDGYYPDGYSYTRNPRDGEYSRHSIHDRAIARLEAMMDEATSENEREQISKMIRDIRKSEY